MLYTVGLKGHDVLNGELFERLQTLSRLRLSEEEAAALLPQMERIVDFVGNLDAPDGPEIPAGMSLPGRPPRRDEPSPGLDLEELLRSSPSAAGGLFRVPPVLPPEAS